MIILGIETSCDETAVAVLEQKSDRIQILSNIVASSLELQSNFGGVFPEQADRGHCIA
jgi:N6-L-threonylcarbamoyladenine synthase